MSRQAESLYMRGNTMSEELRADIAIVGGGAAGLMAALHAAQTGSRNVVILERHPRVGKKLLATGNGRCNLTNTETAPIHYHGAPPAFIVPVLTAFPPQAAMAFFHRIGIYCKTEEGGRVYPYSDQASSVLDCLRAACVRTGRIREMCGFHVTALRPGRGGFTIIGGEEGRLTARRAIVTTGGKAAPSLCSDGSGYSLLEALGHRVTPLFPSLVQLRTENTVTRRLKGIKFLGAASFLAQGNILRTEEGEILFTEYGLSGPPVFALSRLAGECKGKAELSLTLFPGKSEEELCALLTERARNNPEVLLEDFLTGMLHKRIGQEILKGLALPLPHPVRTLDAAALMRAARRLSDWRFTVLGGHSFQNAQVTAGGICTDEVNPMTMESRRCPGLYLAGEVLDVDGDCGGFNLQWAWSSGALAGQSAARGKES